MSLIPPSGIPRQIAYVGTLLLEQLRACQPGPGPHHPPVTPTIHGSCFEHHQATLLLSLGQLMARFSPKAKDLFRILFLQQFAILSTHLAQIMEQIQVLQMGLPLRPSQAQPRELQAGAVLSIQALSQTLDLLLTGTAEGHKTLRGQIMASHEAWQREMKAGNPLAGAHAPSLSEQLSLGRLLGLWEQSLLLIGHMNQPPLRPNPRSLVPATAVPPIPHSVLARDLVESLNDSSYSDLPRS